MKFIAVYRHFGYANGVVAAEKKVYAYGAYNNLFLQPL